MRNEVLNDSRISRLVELALMEDIGLGDLTSESIIPDERLGEAEFLCKEDGIIAGLEVAALTMQLCDSSLTCEQTVRDGGRARRGQVIARVKGLTRGILKGERTALNFLQRMSGIATMTSRYVEAVRGTRAKITDTRKTAPGLRVLDKLAVTFGGGVNHRLGLDDMVLIKDNHIAAAGGIGAAVERCSEYLRLNGIRAAVEVEAKNLSEVQEVLACEGIKRIMLDNFSPETMREAVRIVNLRYETEASGGITLETVRIYADTGVDFISVGALTHSVKALDISLELLPGRS